MAHQNGLIVVLSLGLISSSQSIHMPIKAGKVRSLLMNENVCEQMFCVVGCNYFVEYVDLLLGY